MIVEKKSTSKNKANYSRALLPLALEQLRFASSVALLGPRQVGKTTLAKAIALQFDKVVSLDLQLEEDRAKLSGGSQFLYAHRDHLVVLDEVQYVPELFSRLRPEIDAQRTPGRFLLLGSASGKLLQQSSESLAGRTSYLELTPFQIGEVQNPENVTSRSAAQQLLELQTLWLRGGFPVSFGAPTDALSFGWRNDFISTFVNRDLREFGLNVPPQAMQRFWRMLAHLHGQIFNASNISASLGGISRTTVTRYLDSLVDTMMIRRLEPHFVNVGKRLVKSPKVYVRDSGLLHALLNIADINNLSGNPIAGHSWEGMMIEQICMRLPKSAMVSYYRTAAGAELDLVVEIGQKKLGFEIKFSNSPSVTKGFWQACEDIRVDHAFILAPVQTGWAMEPKANFKVDVISPFQIDWAIEQAAC